ncbi:Long-chain-fatty-acid--CoA ligase, partial [hydrothermal vent metagenome]
DVVGIMSSNCPQSLIAYQAILRIGAILTQINPMNVEREIEDQIIDAGAKVVVALDILVPKIENLPGKGKFETIIAFKLQDYMPWPLTWLFPIKLMVEKRSVRLRPSKTLLMWKELMVNASEISNDEDIDTEDVALIQYTGGTTGTSKGALLTHRNILANALQGKKWFVDAKEGSEVFILVLPSFHAFGMTVGMNLAIALGAKMILSPKFDAYDIMKLIEKHKATIFPGVPVMYAAINNHPKARTKDISSIKYCVSGGAGLAQEVREKFEKLTGGALVEGYGLTEASPITHCNPLTGGAKKGSIGLPLPSTESKIIIGDNFEETKTLEVGELVVKGPQVMKGYHNRPEETANVIKNGWLITGDMGYVDEDGFVFLKDRKKDMIISGGENVYPRDVEEVLFKIDGIMEASVVGMEDARWGEKVVAVVVLEDGRKMTEQQIIEECKKELARYKIPKRVVIMHSLPKTIIGKVLKRELKAQLKDLI